MMFIERIETVLPCFSDPWKLRIIAHLNCPPDLKELERCWMPVILKISAW